MNAVSGGVGGGILGGTRRPRRLLPGYRLTFGVTMSYVAIIILLPIAAMLLKTSSIGWDEFWRIVTARRSLTAYGITFGSALMATVINALFGLLMAWVLTRYEFPGKRLLDALVDLPFALPTAVAGLTLVTLFSANGWYGQVLEPAGITVNYTQAGIVIAMAFTSIPFVIRTVQPVLEDIQPDVEEAARTLGANRWQVFARVVWPLITPAFIAGCAMSFARSIGEFGAVVFIAGNLPGLTEIVSLLIYIRLDEYNYPAAAALATVVLVVAFLTLFLTNLLQRWQLRYTERTAR